MKSAITAAAIATVTATSSFAGGVDRSGQGIGFMFEKGNYIEFSFASVNPAVSGQGGGVVPNPAQPTPGQASGDLAPSYGMFGVAFKMPVTDKIDMGLILDQPFGASVAYPVATTYFARGSSANLDTVAVTGIGRYRFNDNFSVHGGIRSQTMKAVATIPFIPFGGYVASGDNTHGFGYLVGAAYERPDIALRIALTYNSAITHDLNTVETSVLGAMRASTTKIETPQSVNLDFQTGIAKDTLIFGGVRWVQWSEFDITPADYATLTGGSLVSFDDDTFTYTLGVGRRLNENWAIAGSIAHEKSNGGFSSNLSPTDGKTSLGLGVTYTQDAMKITAGVSQTWIGDAQTQLGGSGLPAGVFTDNTATAFGMKIGFSF